MDNELSDCYFNIGETYFYEKQYQKALDLYMQGLKIDQIHDNKFNMAGDYNMIGELYAEMANLGEAQKFFEQSISAAGQIDARPELAGAYYNLAQLYKKKNQEDKAEESLRRAEEIYRNLDPSIYPEIKQTVLRRRSFDE